jgi:hypothetical protein
MTALTDSLIASSDGMTAVIDQTVGMNLYRSSDGENVWDTFFEQQYSLSDARQADAPTRLFQRNVYWKRRYLLNRDSLQHVRSSHFVIRKEIVEYASDLRKKYGLERPYACLYFRGTDKKREIREPSMMLYLEKLQPLLEREPDIPILVQTDDQRFIDFAKVHLGSKMILVGEFQVSQTGRPIHFHSNIEGYDLGVESIAVMLFLAWSTYLFKNSSNVADFAAMYRDSPYGVVVVPPAAQS